VAACASNTDTWDDEGLAQEEHLLFDCRTHDGRELIQIFEVDPAARASERSRAVLIEVDRVNDGLLGRCEFRQARYACRSIDESFEMEWPDDKQAVGGSEAAVAVRERWFLFTKKYVADCVRGDAS